MAAPSPGRPGPTPDSTESELWADSSRHIGRLKVVHGHLGICVGSDYFPSLLFRPVLGIPKNPTGRYLSEQVVYLPTYMRSRNSSEESFVKGRIVKQLPGKFGQTVLELLN